MTMSEFNDIKEAKSYREIAIEKIPEFMKDWRGTLFFAVLNVLFGVSNLYFTDMVNYQYSNWLIPGEAHIGLGVCGLLIVPIEYYGDDDDDAISDTDDVNRAQLSPPSIPWVAITVLLLAVGLYSLGGLPLTIVLVGLAGAINLYLSSPKAREVVGI
jgi:hypothetical protein